jgi:hypothetical protein
MNIYPNRGLRNPGLNFLFYGPSWRFPDQRYWYVSAELDCPPVTSTEPSFSRVAV